MNFRSCGFVELWVVGHCHVKAVLRFILERKSRRSSLGELRALDLGKLRLSESTYNTSQGRWLPLQRLLGQVPSADLIIDELEEQHVVIVSVTAEGAQAQLTDASVKRLLTCRWAYSDGPALCARNLPPAKKSHWELVLDLLQDGWTWHLLPTGPAKKELHYRRDSPKMFYTTTALPHKLYLVCLLVAEDVFAMGAPSIPHWSRCPKQAGLGSTK